MKNIAVILAGGKGNRLGNTTPKQFLKIAGKKVIEHTIDVFQNNSLIDEICVVTHPDYEAVVEDIALRNHYTKLKRILNGGAERYHSSLAAINSYAGDGEANLIFHDSVRPLVNDRIINDCIAALKKYAAVDVAIPTTDTIISVDSENEIIKIPRREMLRNGQTPQAFHLSVIKEAYRRALLDPDFRTTDDCGVVLKYMPDTPIYVVKGEQFNIKLTYKEDIFLMDKLFQLKSNNSISPVTSTDEYKRLADKVIVVIGGSYGIGKSICNVLQGNGITVYSFSRSSGVDVCDPYSVAKAFKDVSDTEGKIDYIVNTAGVLDRQPLCDMPYDIVAQSVSINYLGCVNVAKEAYRYLKESKGSILFYTSSSYTRGRAMYSIYSSLKAAIVNLVQALSEEWLDQGIRINCINPERTKTPMRIKNFGIEPDESLLSPEKVALVSLKVLLSSMTGEVVDVRR